MLAESLQYFLVVNKLPFTSALRPSEKHSDY